MVGLSNVDNTSDEQTSSAATQTALDLGKIWFRQHLQERFQEMINDGWIGNVDNTSDANKPVSQAAQTIRFKSTWPTFTGTVSESIKQWLIVECRQHQRCKQFQLPSKLL
jgi:tRNA A37 N6-isopentenylltransferase MiaA